MRVHRGGVHVHGGDAHGCDNEGNGGGLESHGCVIQALDRTSKLVAHLLSWRGPEDEESKVVLESRKKAMLIWVLD
jgi:hypothetical protein